MIYPMLALYIIGGYLYNLHQRTILYFAKEEEFSPAKVLINSVIWPIRVFEIMLYSLALGLEDDDDNEKNG